MSNISSETCDKSNVAGLVMAFVIAGVVIEIGGKTLEPEGFVVSIEIAEVVVKTVGRTLDPEGLSISIEIAEVVVEAVGITLDPEGLSVSMEIAVVVFGGKETPGNKPGPEDMLTPASEEPSSTPVTEGFLFDIISRGI